MPRNPIYYNPIPRAPILPAPVPASPRASDPRECVYILGAVALVLAGLLGALWGWF